MDRKRVFGVLLLVLSVRGAAAQGTLAKIKSAGQLSCGLNREEPEYSNVDAHGNRALFDIDLCKAVAIAVLGPNAKFEMTAYPDEAEALKALETGKIDLLATATPSLTNSARFRFGRTMLFDYEALMVNTAAGVHSARDLAGKKVCYLTETTMQLATEAWMARQRIKFIPFPFQEEGEMEAAFLTNNCLAISADATQLAVERIPFGRKGRDYEILPDVLAKDPLASATRLDDPRWSRVVDWVEEALVQAEESGLSAGNVENAGASADYATQALLGVTPGLGKVLGLDEAWAMRAIHGVGNYGEIFERDLGPKTPMRMERGMNRLWTEGGLMVAGPLR